MANNSEKYLKETEDFLRFLVSRHAITNGQKDHMMHVMENRQDPVINLDDEDVIFLEHGDE